MTGIKKACFSSACFLITRTSDVICRSDFIQSLNNMTPLFGDWSLLLGQSTIPAIWFSGAWFRIFAQAKPGKNIASTSNVRTAFFINPILTHQKLNFPACSINNWNKTIIHPPNATAGRREYKTPCKLTCFLTQFPYVRNFILK